MKSVKFFLIILAMACITFSCLKDEPTLEKPVMLEIIEDQTSYIGQNGNHFYTDIFSNDNDSNIYRLKVKAGVKYHLICIQPDQLYAKIIMVLSDLTGEVIHSSETYEGRPTGSKPDIIFTAANDDELYLKVINYGPFSESLHYNLYFEKSITTNFNFSGYTWESTGNWKIINSEILEFTCSDSREFRWIRLDSNIPDNVEFSLTMKSTTKTALPTFGFMSQGSYELSNWGDYNEELPAIGSFYNFYEPNTIRTINLVEQGAGFNYQEIDLHTIDMKKGVDFRISPTQVMVNNVLIPQCINLGVKKPFYFVIKDDGFDKITFENFQLK